MLTHSSNLNLSSAFNFTTEQIDLSDSNFSGDNQKLLHLFDLNLFQQSTINVSMKNNEQQVDIQFVDFYLQIDSDLRWTVRNAIDKEEPLKSIRIKGNTFTVNLQKNINDANLWLNLTWTPQRHHLVIDIKLECLESTVTDMTIVMRSLIRSERKDALMYGQVSMLELIDDVFPDDPFFSADNLTTLLQDGMNLRQSLCYHWLMYNRINHSQMELQACYRIHNLCNLIGHFVQQKQLFRTPNPCLSCPVQQLVPITSSANIQRVRFGSRQIVENNDRAQVIYLLDGTCHKPEQPKLTLRFLLQLKRLSKVIERQFRSQRIKTEFSLVIANRDGQYEQAWPQPEPQLIFDHLIKFQYRNLKPLRLTNGSSIWNETMVRQSLWPVDGRHSLDFLYQFAYSPRQTSRHFIMIDCSHLTNVTGQTNEKKHSTCRENDIDFNTARNILLQSANYFHVVTGHTLTQRPFSSPKMRRIIGIDWHQVMFEQQVAAISKMNASLNQSQNTNNSQATVAQWLRQHITPNRDLCHVLALETNGSVFNHRSLKQANRQIFVHRLFSNHQTKLCQRCDCTLAKDYLLAQQECFLCQSRPHTVMNRWHHREAKNLNSDNQSVSPQEWTDEDEQQFLEAEGHSYDNDQESDDLNI